MDNMKETNPISDWTGGQDFGDWMRQNLTEETVEWTDPQLARVTRLRLLSDPGFPVWDVSYCFGQLKNGAHVRVSLPFDQLPKGGITRAIIAYAKRDRVYAKGLGVLSAISTFS